MSRKPLDKNKKKKTINKGLAFLLAFLGANLCLTIIENITGVFPPFFVLWELIYTFILYKKFIRTEIVTKKGINNSFKK